MSEQDAGETPAAPAAPETPETPEPRRLPSLAIAAALVALVVSSALERWQMLTESPFPVGIDGYFYPIQLRSLLETGHLQYPASPLAFWLMAPFAAATDPITGAKLGAAIYGALIALPAYALGARLGRSRGAGLVAAALATRSAGSAYLTLEFVKNGIGLVVALTALWLILRALDAPARGRIAAAVLAIVAAALTHKMAAGVVGVIAVPAAVAAAAGRGILHGRRLLYLIGGLVVAALLALALSAVFPKRFPSPADVALFGDLLTTDAQWDAPALARTRTPLTFGHEALTGLILAILARLALSRLGDRALAALTRGVVPREYVTAPAPRAAPADAAAGWAIALLAIVIGLPWLDVTDAQGLGFRLRLAAYIPLALLAAQLAGQVLARVRYRAFLLAALALALCFHTPGTREEGRIVTHPALVTSVHAMTGRVPPDDTVIIPERHIAYMVAWYQRARVSLGPDHFPPEHRWRLMPLAWIEAGSALDRALLAARTQPSPPIGLHPRHPNGMVLVTESTWQSIAASLPAGSRWLSWPTR